MINNSAGTIAKERREQKRPSKGAAKGSLQMCRQDPKEEGNASDTPIREGTLDEAREIGAENSINKEITREGSICESREVCSETQTKPQKDRPRSI
jgi:hypothetical protein